MRHAACASRSPCGWTRPKCVPVMRRAASRSRASSRCAMRPRAEGFALLVMLALLAVIGLYTAATLQESLFGTVLAGTRVNQQRAFVLADRGIEAALQEMASTVAPADYTRDLQPLPGADEHVTVVLRATGDDALPVDFSAGRFVLRRYEIRSDGHAARGARSVQVQGVARVQPLSPEPP